MHLYARRDELIHAVNVDGDPRAHAELRDVQARIADLIRAGQEFDYPAPGSTARSYEVHTGDYPNPDPGRYAPPSHRGGYRESYAAAAPPGVQPQAFQPPMAPARNRSSMLTIALLGVGVALLALLGFRVLAGGEDAASTGTEDGSELASGGISDGDEVVADIRAVLDGMGLASVTVGAQGDTIVLGGIAPSADERSAAIGAAGALAAGRPLDTAGLTVAGETPSIDDAGSGPGPNSRPEALQGELNRVLASTPIIFQSGQTTLSELQLRVLNNVAAILLAYPGIDVQVIGFTDDEGTDEANEAVSLARAQNVKDYLVTQGVSTDDLQVEAMGESTSTGSDAIASLERRVEFKVLGAGVGAIGEQETLRIGIVAPSARNDLAFTQSMVDAVNIIASERAVEIAITDSTFVPEEAAAAMRGYAEQGFDLVVAHGSQFGAGVAEIAPEFPNVMFAWGTSSDTFGLANVYAYDAASQEGGYVLGALAARLSNSKTIGVVGPIEVGDAARYVDGFQDGARAEEAGAELLITYTGSFSDIGLASETAQAHIAGGADVMTGSAQMVIGAISVAEQNGALWFGTQANQAPLAPDIVVASQVYRWEVVLRDIIADIDAGTPSGKIFTATLANGGLVIQFNPDYATPAEVTQRSEELVAEIVAGRIVPAG